MSHFLSACSYRMAVNYGNSFILYSSGTTFYGWLIVFVFGIISSLTNLWLKLPKSRQQYYRPSNFGLLIEFPLLTDYSVLPPGVGHRIHRDIVSSEKFCGFKKRMEMLMINSDGFLKNLVVFFFSNFSFSVKGFMSKWRNLAAERALLARGFFRIFHYHLGRVWIFFHNSQMSRRVIQQCQYYWTVPLS